MKALSFHQPRAEQIVRGEKTVDVRTWRVAYRGPLVIHAARQRRDSRCRQLGFDPDALDYGAIIGSVELTDVVPLDEATYEALRGEHLFEGPFPGSPCYAWHLADPQRFATPVPCRGRMRLFNVDLPVGQEAVLPDDRRSVTRRSRRAPYRATPPPEPDPEHPFVLYTIPEPDGGYRVALYQWPANRSTDRSDDSSRYRATEVATTAHPDRSDDSSRYRATEVATTAHPDRSDDSSRSSRPNRFIPGAMWSIELGGDALRAVADQLLHALRANGYRATNLARAAGSDRPFYLDELTGLRLALILLAVRPLKRHERIEAIGQGVQAMGDEEAYYWFAKCSGGAGAQRAQRALRILLSGE